MRSGREQPAVRVALDDADRWTQVVVDLPTLLATIEQMLTVVADRGSPTLLRLRDRLLDARSKFWWRRRSATWRLAAELADLLDRNPAMRSAYGNATRRLVARKLPLEIGAGLLIDDGPMPPESTR